MAKSFERFGVDDQHLNGTNQHLSSLSPYDSNGSTRQHRSLCSQWWRHLCLQYRVGKFSHSFLRRLIYQESKEEEGSSYTDIHENNVKLSSKRCEPPSQSLPTQRAVWNIGEDLMIFIMPVPSGQERPIERAK